MTMQKPTVLIVEDEAIFALDLRSRLEAMGFDVLGLCATGEAAIEQATDLKPQVVAMDIRLAGAMDGITAATAIRDRVGSRIVYITAQGDVDTIRRAAATNPDGFISKPLREADLRRVLDYFVHPFPTRSTGQPGA